MNPEFAKHIIACYSGLLEAADAFGLVSTPFRTDCTNNAWGLAHASTRFSSQHGTPHIEPAVPNDTGSLATAGSDAIHIYIDLNSARQDAWAVLNEAKREFENTGRSWAPANDMRTFFTEMEIHLNTLDRIVGKAYKLREGMLRREYVHVVPEDYRRQMQLVERDVNNRPVPIFAADVALYLYRAGIPGDYAGAVTNWNTATGQSRQVSRKVIEMYQAGIAPEFAAALL